MLLDVVDGYRYRLLFNITRAIDDTSLPRKTSLRYESFTFEHLSICMVCRVMFSNADIENEMYGLHACRMLCVICYDTMMLEYYEFRGLEPVLM